MFAVSASAETVVKIIWPFSVAGADTAMIRHIVEHANSAQSKYQFVYENRPGAGGSIAAMAVHDSKTLTILGTTSSFYVRPNLYQESHNARDFTMIGEFCSKQPLAIYSKKYSNVNDIVGKNISIGLNPGSITQLISRTVQKNNNITMLEVAYKGTPEASTDMLAGHLDASVDFLGPIALGRMTPDVKIVGITGERNIPGFVTFKSQNIVGLESIVLTDYFFVKSTVDEAIKRELSSILNAANQDNVKKICTDNFGVSEKISYDSAQKLHQANITKWEYLTKGMERQ
jgi:tripartite-type tricarboxylate transporter receptor subunit TctC